MERTIRKRAITYGLTAIALTAVIAALAFNLSVFMSRTPFVMPVSVSSNALFTTFKNAEDLKTYLLANTQTYTPFPYYGPLDVPRLEVAIPGFSASAAPSAIGLMGSPNEYSVTNVQVAGVDELDTVKTDGQYIYALAGTTLSILKAYPADDAGIVSKITFSDAYPMGIFVHGDRLTVIGAKYDTASKTYYSPGIYIVNTKTFVNIYDIAIRTDPRLIREITMTGSYFNSRMIGEYVYFVISQPAYVVYDTVVLPKFYSNGELIKEIQPTEIRYSNGSDDYFQYTTFIAINTQNTIEPPTFMTLMLGGSSTMYVSTENMYITFHGFHGDMTKIYRVHIDANNMTAEAYGKVEGQEINQFSMDEYDNHLRIATQVRLTNGTRATNLYVLDMNLNVTGTLPGLAPGEAFDAARFIDKRCYLSTSIVRRDPFFVIDLANASDPKILGYLKVPGFTSYLHPYDEDHVLGVGMDDQGKVKVSLYDVTNVTAPVELHAYVSEGFRADTPVLTDHKAFLFERTKDLLALPMLVSYSNGSTLQNLFVFNITLSQGFQLKGTITHQSPGINYWDNNYYVNRALYIENVLYSVSNKKIKLNDLTTLAFLKEITLS